jgi:two-component system sensor histidine kinase KdpD
VLLAYLVVVLASALVGGRRPGVASALLAFITANWFFTPPHDTFRVAQGDDVASLVVFLLVALTVAALEDRVARREREARHANIGAETLARATAALAAPDPLPQLCDVLCAVFGIPACAVVEPVDPAGSPGASGLAGSVEAPGPSGLAGPAGAPGASGLAGSVEASGSPGPAGSFGTPGSPGPAGTSGRWRVLASAGDDPPIGGAEVDGPGVTAFPVGATGARLLARARLDGTSSGHILEAVADQLAVALERRDLQHRAAEAAALAEADRLRVGLLRSVSHDLRSPLAAIKANVTALQRRDVHWDAAEVAEQLAAVDREADRLNRLVGNLLDASRLQAGEVRLQLQPTALEDVISAAVADAGAAPGSVQVDAEPTVPLALVDPELLTRSLANLVSNALAWSPPGCPVRVEAAGGGNGDEGGDGDEVVVRVIDHGPGIPAALRDRVVRPFQRLGDRSRDTGAGLGLAIASGFVTAMHGRLTLGDTPGGGLTATIAVPRAAP